MSVLLDWRFELISYLYLACLIVSVLILAGYCMVNDKYSLNTLAMMLAVIVSNSGHYFLVISKSLDSAISATRLTFTAGCFLPMIVFFSMLEICQIKIAEYKRAIIYLMQTALFGITCGIGLNNLYIKSMDFKLFNGVPFIEKTYGPFYYFYIFTFVLYFVLCLSVLFKAEKLRNVVSFKNVLIVFGVYIFAFAGYLLERLMNSPYSIVPFVNTYLTGCLIIVMNRNASSYYTQDNITRVYEQSNDSCFISFGMNLEYMGSNAKAKELFCEIATFSVDKPVPESAELFNKDIISRLESFRNNGEYDNSYIKIGDSEWEIKIHDIKKRQEKIIGYLVELMDISQRLEYVSMVEEYNHKLQKEVDEKTQRVQEMQQRMVMGFDHSETAYSIIKVEVDDNNQPYDWSYVYVNDSMTRLLGTRKEELLGKKFLATFTDGDEKWLNYYYPAAYEGKTFLFEATPQEIGIFMKVQCFPLDYGYCGCVFEDASTTKDIMRNKAELEMINDALCSDYTATYVVDMETGFTHMYEKNSLFRKMNNKLFARGHYDDFAKTITSGNFVIDSDKSEFDSVRNFAQLKNTMSENNHYIISYRMVFNGVFLYYQTHFAMTYHGNRKYCIIALKNINDQIKKEIEQKQIIEDALKKAEVANESKSSFLSSMSHEIRTPINAILGMDEMIVRECKEPSIREYARNIQSAGKTLLGIINDILDFSKIESGKMEIICVEYDLGSLINDLTNMIRPKTQEKGLEFNLEIDGNTPAILFGDEIRIKQILLNILNNAVKYTEKGHVTLKIGYEKTQDDDTIMLCASVEDSGKGIKEEDREKLFKPFERLDEYNNRSIEGTGLGISITQNLLSMMGSGLEVSSVYGEGSVFSCKILQEVKGSEVIGDIEEKYKNSLREVSEYKERFMAPDAQILVVDDVQMNLFVVRDLLKYTKVNLDMALSGAECINLSAKKKYDLILLDHMMPEMDGIETFKVLRKEGQNVDTPVIILTANAISGAREKYLDEGFTDYLTKPIDPEKLEKMIMKYLPQEKIDKELDDKIEPSEELGNETIEIINKLSQIDNIDVKSGENASGGTDIYLMACKEFSISSMSKHELIAKLFEDGDIKNYTIQVHGMKSVSRLIGCNTMAKMAEKLEMAGNEGNIDYINKNTQEFLDMLQEVSVDVTKVFESKEVKPDITKEELADGISAILEVIEVHDFDSADMIIAEVDKYNMPDNFADTFIQLKMLVSGVDRDGIIELLTNSKDEWMEE